MKLQIEAYKTVIITAFLFCAFTTLDSAQSEKQKTDPPQSFIGIGTGINDCIIGVGAEHKLANHIWFYGNMKLTEWGRKLDGGLTYYLTSNGYKSSISLGYAYLRGTDDYVKNMKIEQYRADPIIKMIHFRLEPVHTLDLKYAYHFKVTKKSKLVMSAGYSLLLTEANYLNKTSYTLNDKLENHMTAIQPGGITLGINYMFYI